MHTEKLNLLPMIREIKEHIMDMEKEYMIKVKPYHECLKALRQLNTVCEKCNGKGKVLRSRSCAEDDRPDPLDPRDYIKCDICEGTGVAHYGEEDNASSKICKYFCVDANANNLKVCMAAKGMRTCECGGDITKCEQ